MSTTSMNYKIRNYLMPLPCALHVALDKSWSVLKFNVEEPDASKAPNIPGTTAYAAPGQSLPQSGQECPKCAQLQMEVDSLRAKLASMQGGQM